MRVPVERVCYYFVYCDACGKSYHNEETGESAVGSEKEVLAAGWELEREMDAESTTATCPKCKAAPWARTGDGFMAPIVEAVENESH